ncbi:MAG: hypothetical protein JWM11_3487 [Planctomycetaceae bacterium]|nr:hypothetical protein [Planctomycetaceae bacterium]
MSFFKNLFCGSIFKGIFGSSQPLTQDEFAALLCRDAKKAGETCRFEYDRDTFQVRFLKADGTVDVTSSLQNVYAEYLETPVATRPAVVKRFLRGILSRKREMPDEFEDARPDILPVIRSRFFSERLKLERRNGGEFGKASDLLGIPLGDQFESIFVYDLPDSMRYLGTGALEDWDVSIYEVAEAAKHNLGELSTSFAGIEGQFYLCAEADNYASSRILLVDNIRQLQVQGDWVAMVPNRDTLLITGSEDVDGLGMMAHLAEEAYKKPRRQGLGLLRLVDNEWETWFPPEHSPNYAQFRKLELLALADEYSDQQEILDKVLQKELAEQFVSSYSIVQKPDGELFSYCVWSEGCTALLPKSQKVVFTRSSKTGKTPDLVATADWNKVQQVLGHRLKETDYYPPRWLVDEFPTETEFHLLGNDPF